MTIEDFKNGAREYYQGVDEDGTYVKEWYPETYWEPEEIIYYDEYDIALKVSDEYCEFVDRYADKLIAEGKHESVDKFCDACEDVFWDIYDACGNALYDCANFELSEEDADKLIESLKEVA